MHLNKIAAELLTRGSVYSDKTAQETPSGAKASESRLKAGNYRKHHRNVAGLDIAIENPAGSIRSGTDPDGKEWATRLRNHYGYIKGTVGKDKDHLDCFIKVGLSPDTEINHVYIINQRDPETKEFDEHKIMIGWDSVNAARKAYYDNYERGWKGLDSIVRMTMDDFKKWMKNKKATKKPVLKRIEKKGDDTDSSFLKILTNNPGISNNKTLKFLEEAFEHKTNPDYTAPGMLSRSRLPKKEWKEEDFKDLGFLPSYAVVPEAGQTKLRTFRHPDHNFHIHEHEDGWIMHEDAHSSLSMLLNRKGKKDLDAVKEAIKHVVSEGTPASFRYTAAALSGAPSWKQTFKGEIPSVKERIGSTLKNSALLGATGALAGGALPSESKNERANRAATAGLGVSGGVLGLTGGTYAAAALSDLLQDSKKDSESRNWKEVSALVGLPLLGTLSGAYGGAKLGDALVPYEEKKEKEKKDKTDPKVL